ncbi:hypothetical protein BRAO375_2720003 [Bradyrhizobium sp. ORS 375]|nr:hypothetical protein BRAO375_2720003 [Bradyrhizobium sp. ORS 375]
MSAGQAFVARRPSVHRFPVPRVVTIARYAPLLGTGWLRIARFLKKGNDIFVPLTCRRRWGDGVSHFVSPG